MNVLITGGAGFIGSNLVEHHLKLGDEVFIVDDMSSGTENNIKEFRDNSHFRLAVADLLTWPDINEAAIWADKIYHLAAVVGVLKTLSDPIKVLATNVAASERLLRAVHLNPRKPVTLIASTSEVYGFTDKELLTEDTDFVVKSNNYIRWSYAISKIADEAFAQAYVSKFKDKIITVRLFNTVGPKQTGRYGMVVPRFVDQAVHNKPITIFGDGHQRRSFCDVRDTVSILEKLTNTPKAIGQIINVGNYHDIAINDLAQIVCKLADSQSQLTYLSYKEAYGYEFSDIQHRKPDLTRMQELIHYQHQWTLESTIKDLIQRKREE